MIADPTSRRLLNQAFLEIFRVDAVKVEPLLDTDVKVRRGYTAAASR